MKRKKKEKKKKKNKEKNRKEKETEKDLTVEENTRSKRYIPNLHIAVLG